MHFGCGYTGAKSLQWDQILYEVTFEYLRFFIVRFSNFIFLHQTTQRWVTFFHSLLVQKIFVTTGRIMKSKIFSFATLIPPHSLENFKVSSEEKFCSSHVHICQSINTPENTTGLTYDGRPVYNVFYKTKQRDVFCNTHIKLIF